MGTDSKHMTEVQGSAVSESPCREAPQQSHRATGRHTPLRQLSTGCGWFRSCKGELRMVQHEALIFSQTVEGLFRALEPLSEANCARFRALGVDPRAPLSPAYPVEVWLTLMKAAVEVNEPEAPFDEALERLGRKFVDGYGETMLGKAMLAVLRVMGPTWALSRLRRTLSTGSNFFESQLVERGAGEVELWINRVTWPAWYLGLVARGLERAGARNVQVSLLAHEGPSKPVTLLVKWV